MLIWKRYLFFRALKTTFFFLFAFYFLFIFMDYSIHMKEFLGRNLSITSSLLFYGWQFFKTLDLLLPFSFLLALIHVITSLNGHRELLALQVAGIKTRKILRPFLLLTTLFSISLFANMEWTLPRSLEYTETFQKTFLKKAKSRSARSLHMRPLEDGSRLIYQTYDSSTQRLFDTFWMISSDEMWHMKWLALTPSPPLGEFVDHFERVSSQLQKTQSHDSFPFERLKIDLASNPRFFTSFESRALSDLFHLTRERQKNFENRSAIFTQFSLKLVLPLIPFLSFLGIIPFCLKYQRGFSTFVIFVSGIFGLMGFFTLLNAGAMLGESRVVPPFWAIFSLPLLLLIFFGANYFKRCKN